MSPVPAITVVPALIDVPTMHVVVVLKEPVTATDPTCKCTRNSENFR